MQKEVITWNGTRRKGVLLSLYVIPASHLQGSATRLLYILGPGPACLSPDSSVYRPPSCLCGLTPDPAYTQMPCHLLTLLGVRSHFLHELDEVFQELGVVV